MAKVLGIGNALTDMLVSISDSNILDELELPKGGMQLIDQNAFTLLRRKLADFEMSVVSGGSASNTIAGLAELNVSVGYLGQVGNDSFGEFFAKDLAKRGVKLHLKVRLGEASGVATTFVSSDGQRTFATHLGAAALLSSTQLDIEDFHGYEYLYLEGYLVQSHDLLLKAISLAKEARLKIVVDLASYNIVLENKDFLLSILKDIDIIFANEEEAQSLCDLSPEKAVSKLQETVGLVIVKEGANGSWIQSANQKLHIPAYYVPNVIDTTGAGDLYASGFLYGLINNYDLRVCGAIGSLLGAKVIQSLGAKIDSQGWVKLKSEIQLLINSSK